MARNSVILFWHRLVLSRIVHCTGSVQCTGLVQEELTLTNSFMSRPNLTLQSSLASPHLKCDNVMAHYTKEAPHTNSFFMSCPTQHYQGFKICYMSICSLCGDEIRM